MGRLRYALAWGAVVCGLALAADASACTLRPPEEVVIADVVAHGRRMNTDWLNSSKVQTGGNVTDITAFLNRTRCRVQVAKRDAKFLHPDEEVVQLTPGSDFRTSFWVPWNDDWSPGPVMTISFEGVPYFLVWQRGDRLRFTTRLLADRTRSTSELKSLIAAAPEVPGLAVKGGQRVLHLGVTREGTPYFRFEGVSQ